VKSIQNGAFECDTNIVTVTFGASVLSIGSYAFDSCSNITTVFLPAGVASIGNNAFSNCTNLKSVFYQGSNVISNNAFSSCDNLGTICTSPDYNSASFCGKNVTYGNCRDFMQLFNQCYVPVLEGTDFVQQKRKNATEWESRSNQCYEYQCDNSTGPISHKRQNATEWEEKTTPCVTFECAKTGPRVIIHDEAEWNRLQPQQNLCHELVCDDNGTWVVKINSTEWERKSNNCFDFICTNESGLSTESKCGNDDICLNDACTNNATS